MPMKMKDIAEALGVSISTVSRAMKNDPHISLETRKRVMKIARENNFQGRNSPSRKILYIIDKDYFLFTSNFYNPLIGIIKETVHKEGYDFQFTTIQSGEDLSSTINFNDVAGVIMTSSYIEMLVPEFNRHNIPVVLLDSYLPFENTSAVLTDNVGGLLRAVKHLADQGHTHIGYLEGDLKDVDCMDRVMAFRQGMEMFQLPLGKSPILPCKLSMHSSYQCMMQFLQESSDIPTAFIGVNDTVTIGGMQAVKDFGLRVPEDISFIGFDDIDLANEVVPKLTTIHVDRDGMGILSVKRLIELIEKKPIGFHKMLISPTLVERNSVASRIKNVLINSK